MTAPPAPGPGSGGRSRQPLLPRSARSRRTACGAPREHIPQHQVRGTRHPGWEGRLSGRDVRHSEPALRGRIGPAVVRGRAERGTETAMFHADLHIHSKYSRACSRDCDIPHLAAGALRKGISVLGTGDFTHPAWADELKGSLVPAEAGLLRLRPDLERDLRRHVPAACEQPVRFMLSVEISTIYRRDERTRKVHHLIYAPTFEAADRITASLAKIGNVASDGRPILGLDSRDLLEITLEAGPGCYLVPAHIWTPWFAVLGSRSGFDAVADCYGDLAGEIFAVETGLSSDSAHELDVFIAGRLSTRQ